MHLPDAGNRAASFAGVLRPLTAAPSGSVASPRLSGKRLLSESVVRPVPQDSRDTVKA